MRQRKMPTKESPYVTFAAALNYFDPDQRKMIDHIEKRTNFSEYIKRLIMRDMEGVVMFRSHKEESFDEREQFDEGLMKGLI